MLVVYYFLFIIFQTVKMPDVTVPEIPFIQSISEGINYVPKTDQYHFQWNVPLDNGDPIFAYTVIHYQVDRSWRLFTIYISKQ